jgi:hypothetical protein
MIASILKGDIHPVLPVRVTTMLPDLMGVDGIVAVVSAGEGQG